MKYIFVFLFVILSLSAHEKNDFYVVSNISEIEFYLKKYCTPSQTLIVFDVDYVLITPREKVFRPCGEQEGYRKKLFSFLKEKTHNKFKMVNEKEMPLHDYLMSILIIMTEYECVDPQMACLIVKLQQQNIRVIALTHNQSGPLGIIPSQSTKKIRDLKKLGIEFKNPFLSSDFIVLNQVSSKDGSHPIYDRGVLFTNGAKKGETLKSFLIAQNYIPSNVIFIDDRREFLESVHETLKSLNIPFTGLHFIQLAEKHEKLDKSLANYQFQFLLENGIWLSDELAEENKQRI